MDPSKHKPKSVLSATKKRPVLLPLIIISMLLLAGGGGAFLFISQHEPPLEVPIQEETPSGNKLPDDIKAKKIASPTITPPKKNNEPDGIGALATVGTSIVSSELPQEQQETNESEEGISTPDLTKPSGNSSENEAEALPDELELTSPLATESEEDSTDMADVQPDISALSAKTGEFNICSAPLKRLNAFYRHLDQALYLKPYNLETSSYTHFTSLIEKLLANPPHVTRESDDLYTILKNTAHFFRVSGKNNILMLKGILNEENDKLEQILADYYFLINTQECDKTKYALNINHDGLYEYGCFFLNTMGGRLYLFRRDARSRMVVTYYAILLIDAANRNNSNRHGLDIRPAVNMLISEMESSGASLKKSELYLDSLYDMKERYQ